MTPDTLKFLLNKFNVTDINIGSPIDVFNFNRANLAKLFFELGFKCGAEIGIENGYYSEVLCKANPNLHLYCIDPWEVYEDDVIEHRNSETMEGFYNSAKERLSKYNCTIIRKTSSSAVKKFRGQPFDFVFIDGDHCFEPVINDLTNYSMKVRPGGIIAGHDYWGRFKNKYMRVGPAVKLFVKAYNIDPWFTIGRQKSDRRFKRDSERSFLWVKE
jgi:hypothetical protein